MACAINQNGPLPRDSHPTPAQWRWWRMTITNIVKAFFYGHLVAQSSGQPHNVQRARQGF
jgi:hypothetical protein